MAITATLTVSPASPAHGQTVTATYAVQGNGGTPGTPGIPGTEPVTQSVTGDVTVGDTPIHVSTSLTIPGTPGTPGTPGAPPLAETFAVPTCPGLTFTATADPKVFTALVP